MTLTPLSSPESGRKKIGMSRKKKFTEAEMTLELGRTSCLESGNQTFFAQEAEMTLTPLSSPESGRKKFLMNRKYIMSRKGIKRFCATEAEMTLAPLSSPESARKNFLMNSTYIMSRK